MDPPDPPDPHRRALLGKLRIPPPEPVQVASQRKRSAALVQPPLELPAVKKRSSGSSNTANPSASSSSAAANSFTTTGPQNSGEERLRDVTKGFFLENKLSARDIAKMSRGGLNSGAEDVGDLARSGARGRQPQNCARDLMRKFLKETDMPPLFWHNVQIWNADSHQPEQVEIPFLLPHQVLASVGDRWNLLGLNEATAPQIWNQFATQCGKLDLDPSCTVPLGLHGDGVPFTKKHSLELLSWNILGDATGDRVPFTGISKAYVCKCGCLGRHTWDSILEIFAWSMRAATMGVHPSLGPGGIELQGFSKSLAGKTMPKALLCQVRGDWPFLKALLSVPAWNNARICWQCTADKSGGPSDYREVSLTAAWRQHRLGTRGFFRTLQQQNLSPSTLFGAPGLLMEHVVLDWLHIVDLGISQDLIGNLLHELVLNGLPGNNKQERLHVLWDKMKSFYVANKSPVRLGELTLEMFERSGKSPKLRAKGGETRHLVPFAASVAAEMARTKGSDHWKRVSHMFHLLLECAKHAASTPFVPEDLARDSRKMCVLWKTLVGEAESKGDFTAWKMKPKVHLFQELCEYKALAFGSPELFWTYQDESFCGFLAKAAKRRGGQNFAATVPQRLLDRYRALRGS